MSLLGAALLIGVLGTVALGAAASAQSCGVFPNPACTTTIPAVTSTTVRSTTTTDEVTTTTEDLGSNTDSADTSDTTETTRRRSTATTEEVTTTVFSVSTSVDVLVKGDGTAGAESTTTEPKLASSNGGGLSDNQLVVLIVSGLALLASAVGVLTWRYWRATRPVEVPVEPEPRAPRRDGGPRTQRSVFLDP